MRKPYWLMAFITLFYSISLYAEKPMMGTAAQPMFVIDQSSLEKLNDQITTLTQSLKEMQGLHKDLNANLTGHFTINNLPIGDMYNSDVVNAWQWSGDDWASVLQNIAGGNNQRYRDLIDLYKKQYPIISSEELTEKYHVEPYQSQIYTNAVNTNATVMSQAAYQYNDINNRMQEIKELSGHINNATTEKEAMDLNSRLIAQLAYIQLAALRLQTLTNQQLAEQRAAVLASEKHHIEFTSHTINP